MFFFFENLLPYIISIV